VKRAGGWVLGLVAIAAMVAGGWWALRGAFNRETVGILYEESGRGDTPTRRAILRGAELALAEATHRAGRYRVALLNQPPFKKGDAFTVAARIGTSEALAYLGQQQEPPFCISVVDTHPHPPTKGSFRVTPGCDRQGQTAAAWTMKAGATRVALLQDKTSLRSLAIAAAFEASIPLVHPPFDASVENVDTVLASKPDLVFFSGEEAPYSTTFKIFSALRAKGFRGPLVTAEADPEVSFLATRPDLVEGSYLVTPFLPAPRELAVRMNATPGPHVTAGYLAMRAALRAIDRADSIDPATLLRAAGQLPEFDPSGASTRPCAIYIARNGIFEFVEELK
jgi:hypothetical protein